MDENMLIYIVGKLSDFGVFILPQLKMETLVSASYFPMSFPSSSAPFSSPNAVRSEVRLKGTGMSPPSGVYRASTRC